MASKSEVEHITKVKGMMAMCNCSLKSGHIQKDFHRFYLATSIDVDIGVDGANCGRSIIRRNDGKSGR